MVFVFFLIWPNNSKPPSHAPNKASGDAAVVSTSGSVRSTTCRLKWLCWALLMCFNSESNSYHRFHTDPQGSGALSLYKALLLSFHACYDTLGSNSCSFVGHIQLRWLLFNVIDFEGLRYFICIIIMQLIDLKLFSRYRCLS